MALADGNSVSQEKINNVIVYLVHIRLKISKTMAEAEHFSSLKLSYLLCAIGWRLLVLQTSLLVRSPAKALDFGGEISKGREEWL